MTDLFGLQYPVGRFIPPLASTAESRSLHIQTLRLLPGHLRVAVSGLSDEQLDTPYRDGGWTVRQVVHHVADSGLPVDVSLTWIESLHERWIVLLESMSEDDFQKGFVHPEMGRQKLETTLALYDWHSRHHTAHITGLRGRLGW